MKHDVLNVDDQIERDHAGHDGGPSRNTEKIEQTPAPALGNQRHPNRGRWHQQPHRHDIDRQDTEIAGPAGLAAGHQLPPRRQPFPQPHGAENQRVAADADRDFEARRHE